MAGRFKKVSRIGRGTFGEAWLVTSACSGRRYVIKEVRVDEMSVEELEKTRTEATILARCKHNSIIRYKEYFMLPNPATMCLVMEYADGGDLAGKVKMAKRNGETLPEPTVLHWFIQVIFAVQYLHANNILHRDLKTQNIFLTKTNLVKVGDFGIARFLRDKQDLATTAIGTPFYLSPEICQRRPYNHKSDMWAVGCILYELCALRHPFDAEKFEDLVVKILRGAFRPLPQKFSSLIKDLVSVMLRTNPERRPTADALLMLPALKTYVENYLQQYEELLNNNVKRPGLADEKMTEDKSSGVKGGDSPATHLDDKIKVHELDKQKSNKGGRFQSLERKDTSGDSPKCSEGHPPTKITQTPNKSEIIPIRTPSKVFLPVQRYLQSMSTCEDWRTTSPRSPELPDTPPRNHGSLNSPVHPPAPPNTPVNGLLSVNEKIPLLNIASICPTDHHDHLAHSPCKKKHLSESDICVIDSFAPTPFNTPTELDIPLMTPAALNDDDVTRAKPAYDRIITKTSAASIYADYSSLGSPQRSPFEDEIGNTLSQRNIHSKGRCHSCGKGWNETFVINKYVSDSPTDNVFE